MDGKIGQYLFYWANDLFPKKTFIDQIEQGRIPLAFLDLITKRKDTIARVGHQHGTDHHDIAIKEHEDPTNPLNEDILCNESQPIIQLFHHSSVTSTIGWICWDGLIFDAERISCWLSELSILSGVRRIKAVIRTNEGWCGFNFVDTIKDIQPNGYRRDSRLEIIVDSPHVPDADTLETKLRNCINQ